MPRVLLVSRDPDGAGYLTEPLTKGGFEIRWLNNGLDAVAAVATSGPDVIVVDLLLSDIDPLSLCQYLRQAYETPIVVFSSSGQEEHIVRALEAGADDYLVMPVRPVELVARVRAVLRRIKDVGEGHPNRDRLLAGDVEVRLDEHRAYRRGTPLELSPIEFRLLACLVRESGRVVSHSKLISKVWGPEYASCRHYLRLYVRYLRSKLEDDPRDPKLILSDWGVGYRFQPSSR